MWEVGRLDYPSGAAEMASFVNIDNNLQLQNILCTKKEASPNRFSLLIPYVTDKLSVLEVEIETDGEKVPVYAEVNGNTIEFHVDNNIITSLASTPDFKIHFLPDDAEILGLDQEINVPIQGSNFANQQIASECTILCLNNGFSCNRPLVSSFLWPIGGFQYKTEAEVEKLCTKDFYGRKEFNLTEGCKILLDRFYQADGLGPLSFLHDLFFAKENQYLKYKNLWNEVIAYSASSPTLDENVFVNERDWYMILFSLISKDKIIDYTKSYNQVLKAKDDPTTLLYDIDNRYEMEALKYTAVLMRRIKSSVMAQNNLQEALNAWNDFYRDFCASLPSINRAQALRPLVYREMLMRLWHLAGRPHGIEIKDENLFVQGKGGKTTTADLLEKSCTVFDGINQEQFFFNSDTCERLTRSVLRERGLLTDEFELVHQKFQDFVDAWQGTVFDDKNFNLIREQLYSNFNLVLISLNKIYGFGDYFLMRECISSRDDDICQLERNRAKNAYTQEFNNRVRKISAVNIKDANELNNLHNKFLDYAEALDHYVNSLVQENKIETWQALFALSMNTILQTNTLITMPYYNEVIDDLDFLVEGDD